MTDLYNRRIELTVGTLDISNLDCNFKVKKTLLPTPNTCELSIFNLSESHRKLLEATNKKVQGGSKKNVTTFDAAVVPVRLRVGYDDQISQIFLGELRVSETIRDGEDWVTTITSGDGETARKSRLYLNLGPKVPASQALKAVAKAMGLGEGNLAYAAAQLAAKGITTIPGRGVYTGPAAHAMTDFCESANLEWSIQDNKIQILDKNQPANPQSVTYISSLTGMIGSPSIDNEGHVHVDCLAIPGLLPGQIVTIDSDSIKGGYRIIEIEWSGEKAGQQWYSSIVAKKY